MPLENDTQFLQHTGIDVFTDIKTGAQVMCRSFVYCDGERAWTVICIDGCRCHTVDIPVAEFFGWRSVLFPTIQPQGATPLPPPPPVNIDGSPRKKLQDRLRERWTDPEARTAD